MSFGVDNLKPSMNRRSFLGVAGVVAAGSIATGLTIPATAERDTQVPLSGRRKLGSLEVSSIGLGVQNVQVPPRINQADLKEAMKTIMLGLFLSTMLVQSSYAQQSSMPPTETIKTAANPTPEQQEVIDLSKMKWDWMADKKVDSLEALFDDKAMFTHMGGTWGKAQELATIKSGGIWYKKATVYSVDVRIIGNTAILLNDIDLVAVVGGNEVTNPFMVTEVYVKENGKWKLGQLTFSHLLRPVKANNTH